MSKIDLGQAMASSLFTDPVSDANISFEFFPPNTEKMEKTLWDSITQLESLNPKFVSVTYGAGGSTRERTHKTVKRILDETTLSPAAHLTCVGHSKSEVNAILEQYWEDGVRHIVALRGDMPDMNQDYIPHPQGYQNAADLVKGIKQIADFDISVAAYPEIHPDSPNLSADLDNLKRKIDNGASRAITQAFFEADTYFRFLDHCQSMSIDVPILPGILPVMNYKSLMRFMDLCGTKIPKWMQDLFEDLDDRPQTRSMIAATIANELCRKLYAGGVKDFHIYTLNRSELTYAICHMLGHRPKKEV
ncbi:methylenetetrahydrofolate reductase [Temperatibacter marinus]|uniref:Methylenetetrahydrofolate reductase n=1 Tax=Temperatibacter marinus TaxID=1456591 RepID=A0AA52ECA0_9PROT|nr:methylenetetrahydrofolate reductase [Temperatibacter marinus]WND02070.1 methylenetetrahydrofolate reductase [Temperatibacter marinus]